MMISDRVNKYLMIVRECSGRRREEVVTDRIVIANNESQSLELAEAVSALYLSNLRAKEIMTKARDALTMRIWLR